MYELEGFEIIRKMIGRDNSICFMIRRIARNSELYNSMKEILFQVFIENYSLFEKDVFADTIESMSYRYKENEVYFKKRVFGCLFFELNEKGYECRLKLLDIIIEKLLKEYETSC